MSTYRLDRLFAPRSIALVGASPREKSVGRAILNNLRSAGWPGPLWLVNPKHREIEGLQAIRDLSELSEAPDLVVITVPPDRGADVVAQSAPDGRGRRNHHHGRARPRPGFHRQACEQAARAKGLRLVGPNCLGVLVPGVPERELRGACRMAGDLALISQSGAIAAGLVEWAAKRTVGFSAIASTR